MLPQLTSLPERQRARLETPRSARLDAVAERIEASTGIPAPAAFGCRDARGAA